MPKRGSEGALCKASSSGASPSKHLPNVSSYPAALLAVGFFLVTCFVLFKDVYDGAAITTDHVLSMAVLIGTFASGHLLWDQLKQWQLLPALGLTILFAAGTFYCVTASGGRNAAVQGSKAAEAHKTNDDRARIEGDLKQAKARLEDAQDAEAAECASGDGPRCKGWRKTREERQTYVNVLQAQLRLMEPERQENPELRHAAKLFAAFPGIAAKEEAIFGFLVLYFPFLKALFAEIATLVFGSIGFRPRKETLSLPIPTHESIKPLKAKAATVANVVPFHRPKEKPFQKANALADLLSLESVPSQESLASRWNRSEATVSRWLRAWEEEGKVKRSSVGRCKAIQQVL